MSDEARIKIDAMFKYPIQVTNYEAKQKAYIAGATAERPKAWNEAIDEAIKIVKCEDFNLISQQVKALEMLKHKQP